MGHHPPGPNKTDFPVEVGNHMGERIILARQITPVSMVGWQNFAISQLMANHPAGSPAQTDAKSQFDFRQQFFNRPGTLRGITIGCAPRKPSRITNSNNISANIPPAPAVATKRAVDFPRNQSILPLVNGDGDKQGYAQSPIAVTRPIQNDVINRTI